MSPIAKAMVQAAIGIVVLLVLWTIFAAQANSPVLLPSPGAAVARAGEMLAGGDLLHHFGASFAIFLSGFGPAMVIAGAVAAAANALPRFPFESVARPLAAAPLIAFAPPLVMWLGVGAAATGVLVFIVALFPMLDHVLRRQVPAPAAFAASPASVPPTTGGHTTAVAVLAAARMGLMLGVGAEIVGEMFAARQGVGYLLTYLTSTFDTAGLMATLLLILVPTILIGMLLRGIEEQLAV